MRKINLFFILFSVLPLAGCNADPTSVEFTLNNPPENVEIHTEHQKQYLEDPNYQNIGKYAAYAPNEGYSNPVPVNLSWKVNSAKKYIVHLSEDPNMKDCFSFETTKKSIDIFNLKVKTKYYWTVSACYSSVSFDSEPNFFTTTNNDIRNIFVDGVDNFRDLGGYLTSSNKLVKQGLIYRSGEINKNKESSMNVLATEDGLDTLVNQLKIKTEIDLRKNEESNGTIENSGITSSPISNDVNYINLPMYYDGENMLSHSDDAKNAANYNAIKSFFELLTKKDNYPIVFHCVQGKDRTGLLSYLLNGLLGVSEEDLYRDYLFTNFSHSVGSPCKVTDIQNRYGLTIRNNEGEKLETKIANFLKDKCDFSDEKINAIKSILL